MTTIVRRKYGKSRRLGVSLWGRAKDAFNKRNYPPGQHGIMGYKKLSDFGRQFAAHKKFKFYYAISSKQMRNIFLKAYKKVGDTGDNFIGLLESRLATILYHSGLVPTIFSAKQMVSHKHVTVNDKVVNIPSYVVKTGDIIKIRERVANINMVMSAIQSQERTSPDYLETSIDNRAIKYLRIPKYSEVSYAAIMDINLVIEFYSK